MGPRAVVSERAQPLNPDELLRYSRQINLREFGRDGQRRLKKARVLCIGAGGLGSPAALYLAAAGVGTIGLVDDDEVDLSNLHRQLLHDTADLGRPKTDSARDRLQAINPESTVQLHAVRFQAANARDLISNYDLVIDGSDNLATRYLSNDVCVWQRKANVYGSVHQFEGQVSIFAPHLGGPCYRCLFPEPPPAGTVPSCAEAGVLGAVPGIIGTMQALEAMKLLAGFGTTLVGRFLHFDAARTHFREFKVRRDPACPVCGSSPSITEPIDYEQSCHSDGIPSISATRLQQRLRQKPSPALLDVREPFEFEIARIDGARLLPLGSVPDSLSEISRDEETVVVCKSGVRSAQVIAFLQTKGFSNLLNLEGGIDAWRREVDPALPRY